jgi:acyl-CoA hydrolase
MLVRQEHLNQYGNLFGGRVLAVIDELAFIACSRTYPGRNFVTRAVQNAEFTAPALLGDVLEFNFGIEKVGRTSVHVHVEMLIYDNQGHEPVRSFDGTVIMVCVDEAGSPVPVRA